MEELMIFIAVIFIIFGILQIILFFKLWAMTNNVKEIKQQMFGSSSIDLWSGDAKSQVESILETSKRCIYVGDIEKAKQNLLSLRYDIEQRGKYAYSEQEIVRNDGWIKQINETLETIK